MGVINKNKEKQLSRETLKQILEYDQETGFFWWLEAKQGRDLNRPAGTDDYNKYRKININGVYYLAHRLAFLYVMGEWPPEYVDHVDGNPSNNAWSNLRPATAQQNAWNKKRKYNSFTGIKGVKKNPYNDTWEVQIWIDEVNHQAGPFYSYQAACKYYDKMAKQSRGQWHRQETPRQQAARFKEEDVIQALENFLKKGN